MKELKNVSELEQLCYDGAITTISLLLVTSGVCPACAHFKSIYERLERKIGDFCNLCTIQAEAVGGRNILRESFSKQFNKYYRGFPSLFIVTNGEAHEIPYQTVMWDKNLGKFDVEGMAAYVKKYLFEERLL